MARHVPLSRTVPPRRRIAATAGAVLLALLAAACGEDGEPDGDAISGTPDAPTASQSGRKQTSLPEALAAQEPSWTDCPAPDDSQGETSGKPSDLPDGTPWQCATVKVPLDYTHTDGQTLSLALVRAEKRDNGRRKQGSLIFNFGGPGGSGVASLPSFGKEYEKLRGSYDLVSFDPRGVGRSAGVNCLDGPAMDRYFAADRTPDSAKEEKALQKQQKNFAKGCGKRAGALLPHLTTENTARDMDVLRRILGDRKLHYFGVSYGTELGAVYAHLYPRKVGRAALDAVVDPTSSSLDSSLAQTRGFQLALGNYLRDCIDSKGGCPLGDSEEEAQHRITGLLEKLDRHPMPTQGPRKLTESLATSGIAQALYSEELWSYLTDGLEQALRNDDGTTLLLLGDMMNGRNTDGSYSTLQSSLTAINCADSRTRHSTGQVKDVEERFSDASPVFGPSAAWEMLQCTDWPARGRHASPKVKAEGSAPILLVGTTGDPATPYAGTKNMKEALGEDVAVELTHEGEGHGAYDSRNRCIRTYVDAYLLKGKVPRDGTRCE